MKASQNTLEMMRLIYKIALGKWKSILRAKPCNRTSVLNRFIRSRLKKKAISDKGPLMIEMMSTSRLLSFISSFASWSLSFSRLDATRSSKSMWNRTFLVIKDRGNKSNNNKRVKRLPSNKDKINHKTMPRMINCILAAFRFNLTIKQDYNQMVINKCRLMLYPSVSLLMVQITAVQYKLMPI